MQIESGHRVRIATSPQQDTGTKKETTFVYQTKVVSFQLNPSSRTE